MTFDFTEHKVLLNVWLSAGAAGISVVLCTLVLLMALWVYSKPHARHILDRVSFRLLLWSMGFGIVYDINYVVNAFESEDPLTPNALCAAGVYWMMATLGVVNYLCTCIAVNLMLTICFRIHPIKRRLERWYVGVSVALGFGIPIIPAALGHFGRDPILNVCWIKARDNATRLKYFALDLYLWQSLSCLVASSAVILTLATLFRQSHRTSKAMTMRRDDVQLSLEWRKSSAPDLGHLADQFLKIALRISTYPVALIIVNGIITLGDLYISKAGGVKSSTVYGLYCIYYFLYGGRGIVFAALAIFVDPCLWRGMKAAWYPPRRHDRETPVNTSSALEPKIVFAKQTFLGDTSENIQILDFDSPAVVTGGGDKLAVRIDMPGTLSRASIELSHAPNLLPYEAPLQSPSQPRYSLQDERHESMFTRSFVGVRSVSLPVGLTDDIVVDLRCSSGRREVTITSTRKESDRTVFDLEEGLTKAEIPIGSLEPLSPDLPNLDEERRRLSQAEQVAREKALSLFEETQAQL